ncbi:MULTISPECIES: hypothetical protein [Streptomyces rochei group]|uniref:hypothetical protein n=1 Tax=Streptomyces rochei group TaxID=2867164 RepID=UPI001876DE2F|nr:hypothetical protein [Streptomyces vinaceusdrappus]GHC44261.1 hypothetical protein GCM10010308_74360 [Streptomyces vinaceusdrappus]
MIRPTLTADGQAVRLALRDHITAPLLDDLAVAYADDPQTVGRLLTAHAASVVALDVAQVDTYGSEYDRAIRAAEADGTREALFDGLPHEHQLDPQYPPDEAIALAARITRHAAHIRHQSTKEPRK